MTLLQFISSKLEEDTPIGDLARDAKDDSKFKELKTDKERLEYLSSATHQVSEIYDEFLQEFKDASK